MKRRKDPGSWLKLQLPRFFAEFTLSTQNEILCCAQDDGRRAQNDSSRTFFIGLPR